jgi:hypothetical protein
LFWSFDANHILEIPIAPNGMQYLWLDISQKVSFYGMSAYHAKWEYQFGCHNPNVMHIGESQGSEVWRKLWGLQIPSKIKFLDEEFSMGYDSLRWGSCKQAYWDY